MTFTAARQPIYNASDSKNFIAENGKRRTRHIGSENILHPGARKIWAVMCCNAKQPDRMNRPADCAGSSDNVFVVAGDLSIGSERLIGFEIQVTFDR